MSKLIDLTGQRFGRLTVLERSPVDRKAGHAMWLCQCDCGKVCVTDSYALRHGLTKSCGCRMTEYQHIHGKHNLSRSRLYSIWCSMKARCNRPHNVAYKYYGGRGIHIFSEWENSFESFYNWALQAGYHVDLTIDRIDVNGDYCPQNCRWVDRLEQSRNRRCIRFLTYQGETRPLWEWVELTGIPYSLLSGRVARGWPADRIFNEPIHGNCRNHRKQKNKK